MLNKILVALHPGHIDTPAVDRALAIAQKTEVEIMLYSVVFDEYVAGLRFGDDPELKHLRHAMIEAETRNLEEVKTRFTETHSVTVKVQWQYAIAEGIINTAKQFGADLIIAASTRHSVLTRLALTNTDWDILRHAHVPVLFAHHREFRPYKTVLAAIDPTHPHDEPAALDNELIRQGRQMGDLFGGSTHIGHAYPSQNTLVSVDYTIPDDIAAGWKVTHVRAVNEVAEQHGITSAYVHIIDQSPNTAIPAIAKDVDADLVVIGSISRSFLANLWIGRTTEHVIDHLECDVLAVRNAPDPEQ